MQFGTEAMRAQIGEQPSNSVSGWADLGWRVEVIPATAPQWMKKEDERDKGRQTGQQAPMNGQVSEVQGHDMNAIRWK